MAYWEFPEAPVAVVQTSFGPVRLCGYDSDDVRTEMETVAAEDGVPRRIHLILHRSEGSWTNHPYYPTGASDDIRPQLEAEIGAFLDRNPDFIVRAGKGYARRKLRETRDMLKRVRANLVEAKKSVEKYEEQERELEQTLIEMGEVPPPADAVQITLEGKIADEPRRSKRSTHLQPSQAVTSRQPVVCGGSTVRHCETLSLLQ